MTDNDARIGKQENSNDSRSFQSNPKFRFRDEFVSKRLGFYRIPVSVSSLINISMYSQVRVFCVECLDDFTSHTAYVFLFTDDNILNVNFISFINFISHRQTITLQRLHRRRVECRRHSDREEFIHTSARSRRVGYTIQKRFRFIATHEKTV